MRKFEIEFIRVLTNMSLEELIETYDTAIKLANNFLTAFSKKCSNKDKKSRMVYCSKIG